jgi:transposase-like protein
MGENIDFTETWGDKQRDIDTFDVAEDEDTNSEDEENSLQEYRSSSASMSAMYQHCFYLVENCTGKKGQKQLVEKRPYRTAIFYGRIGPSWYITYS